MIRRIIKIIDNNPRYLRRVGGACVALACLSITVLADAITWPAGILAVASAVLGAVMYDRAQELEKHREQLAAIAAEYERDS